MEKQGKILWVDDEIDLLNSYFIFLEDNSIKNGVEMISKINKIAEAEHREEVLESEDEDL